ncbi:MAG: RNA polymerase factor sigma-54 [Akkermansiaceae bacterium]|jgi:RNA polymerase sigma-54 factor|nr:RNA polymerase factor sigma-54 [Akkermansiaceae bacterium]
MSDFSLQQNLSQQQTLAPQMRKSLEVLQASSMELAQLVHQALETNPVLEDVTESLSLDAEAPAPEAADSLEHLNETDDDWRDEAITSGRLAVWTEDDEERRQHFLESFVAPETLQEHLRRQLDYTLVEPDIRLAAHGVVGNLDHRGWLDVPLRELAARLDIRLPVMEKALRLVQSLDPPGVGASGLRESLLLQLERSGRHGSLEYRIIDGFLEELARRQLGNIARELGVSEDRVAEAAEGIARLSPNPGAAFEPGENPFVTPDVVVEREDGEWVARLTGEGLPSLRINDHYKDMLGSGRTDTATRKFLRERISEGRGLISAIALRQETVLAIATKIVAHQRPFLEHGPAQLRPLTMTALAEEIGMHNTTVSRAVAGKYMLTPHGLLEMRAFFATGFQTRDGGELSNAAVREAIQQLVQREDPAAPLTDEALARALASQGVTVARRTVAKYREQLGILPVKLRRARG